MSAQKCFESLDDVKAPVGKPAGLYQPCLVVGGLVYVSGHLPFEPDGSLILGCLGKDLDVEAGKNAARRAGLASLVTQALPRSLDKISRLETTRNGFATDVFTQHQQC